LKPALTVRNILQRINFIEGARQHVNRMTEFEAHNLAQKSDVLVTSRTWAASLPRPASAKA